MMMTTKRNLASGIDAHSVVKKVCHFEKSPPLQKDLAASKKSCRFALSEITLQDSKWNWADLPSQF